MVVVDFPSDRCSASPVDVTFRYRPPGDPPQLNVSRTVTVPAARPGSRPARVFFPAYRASGGDTAPGFIGIDLPEARADCVRVGRIPDTRSLPLLLDATLPSEWENGPLYARVGLMSLMPESVWVRVARWLPGLAALG